MLTPWGETLDRERVLQEYPRPQLRRESYLNLNGPWQYAISPSPEPPAQFDGEILVPFSPESELSGVNRTLLPDEYLWYRRTVTLPVRLPPGSAAAALGAVDQIATVYVDGTELVTPHRRLYALYRGPDGSRADRAVRADGARARHDGQRGG
jgi:hypothetical protein